VGSSLTTTIQGRISGFFAMNADIELRILSLLRARYFDHEVASIIEQEFPHLNEFDIEDLPVRIKKIKQVI